MKPGYKIIAAGLLIYVGFKVKAMMDVAPYKEKAVAFAGLLKQHKSFEAQALLSPRLQSLVSIETLNMLIKEQNLTQSKELSWSGWQKKEGAYTLQGTFVFAGTRRLPVVFTMISPESNKTWITQLKVDRKDLGKKEEMRRGFLE